MRDRAALVPAVLLVATLLPAGLAAAEAPPPVPATLADVAFMAGHWTGGEDGNLSEEIWSPPHGDSMMARCGSPTAGRPTRR